MKLLFITQKLHGQDAFGVLWIEAFKRRGYDVHVLCLEWRPEEAKQVLGREEDFHFTVHSMGKERGATKGQQIAEFYRVISTLQYDRVFIHMAPVWGALGAPVWVLGRTPVYLWYTHYKMQLGLWMLGVYGKRLFAATPQSLPQYEGKPKKVIVGHGIDLMYWPQRKNMAADPKQLLVVHRLSRSKRLELILQAMTLLPEYSLSIYGIEAEADYVAELKALVTELHLGDRVTFKGSAPAKDLAGIYAAHHLILNMASETIDKTMLEAMTCGCYPMTTRGNATAIGIPVAPSEDTPEAIVEFIKTYGSKAPIDADEMYRVVSSRHSLDALIEKMDHFIRSGS